MQSTDQKTHCCPKTAGRLLLIVLALCGLGGCTRVALRVDPFVNEPYPSRSEGAPISVLTAEPDRPFVKVARITATSHTADEDELRAKILGAARKWGADAVILGKVDEMESTGLGEGIDTTVSPEVQEAVFGGMGNVGDGYLGPGTYEQGPDRVEWTIYLSGVAIRYH